MAIRMIINHKMRDHNESRWHGSYVVDALTDLVEEAVYKEFEAISERGGVLGAMDTMYQRGKIQEESMYYEKKSTMARYPSSASTPSCRKTTAAKSPPRLN